MDNIKCPYCNYKWRTESKGERVTCPKCDNKIRVDKGILDTVKIRDVIDNYFLNQSRMNYARSVIETIKPRGGRLYKATGIVETGNYKLSRKDAFELIIYMDDEEPRIINEEGI